MFVLNQLYVLEERYSHIVWNILECIPPVPIAGNEGQRRAGQSVCMTYYVRTTAVGLNEHTENRIDPRVRRQEGEKNK